MTVTQDPKSIEEAAGELLDGMQETDEEAQQRLAGMQDETKVSVLGMSFATSEKFDVGERVELRVVGIVKKAGIELLEKEGRRPFVSVNADLIEVVSHD